MNNCVARTWEGGGGIHLGISEEKTMKTDIYGAKTHHVSFRHFRCLFFLRGIESEIIRSFRV